jgi:hypothetical protein
MDMRFGINAMDIIQEERVEKGEKSLLHDYENDNLDGLRL